MRTAGLGRPRVDCAGDGGVGFAPAMAGWDLRRRWWRRATDHGGLRWGGWVGWGSAGGGRVGALGEGEAEQEEGGAARGPNFDLVWGRK